MNIAVLIFVILCFLVLCSIYAAVDEIRKMLKASLFSINNTTEGKL